MGPRIRSTNELNTKCSGSVGCPGLKIDPSKELIALDRMGNKYLLGPAFLTETDITRAQVTQVAAAGPSPTVTWTVAYELTMKGADALAAETDRLLDVPGPVNLIAIMVNGVVVSAANVQTVISSGEGTIIGNFDEDSARSLAAELSPRRLDPPPWGWVERW
jgi:preprotein translocase subunit SecD